MVSLKSIPKSILLSELQDRTKQIAMMVSESDYSRAIQRAIRTLNDLVSLHRAVIIKEDQILTYNGGYFIDVSPYYIDELVEVIYSPTPFSESSWIDPELGLLPFISSSSSATSVYSSLTSYIDQLTNLNMMVRQLKSSFDHYLWPVSPDGHQFLQLRVRQPLVEIRFLPYFNPDEDSWTLFEQEITFVNDLSYYYLLLMNAEQIQSAAPLGAFKESGPQTEYFNAQIDKLLTNFKAQGVIGGVN